MKLTATLLVSIVAAAASDDSKMIRGGGLVATAADDETHKATRNVLRSVNFYEAAAQGDFEDIPPNNGHHGDVTVLPTNPCPACAMVGEGNHQFCGVLGIHYVMDSSPCDGTNTCANLYLSVAAPCRSHNDSSGKHSTTESNTQLLIQLADGHNLT